jgi:1,4-dihydroxy-2-naphthoyl-CoA hydrolase
MLTLAKTSNNERRYAAKNVYFCIMFVWKKSLEELNAMGENTLLSHLGMRCTELGDDYLKLTMPVDKRTHQPMGVLHGGATAALIESVGSIGSALLLDLNAYRPVGLELNVNHIRAISEGMVEAKGTIVHAGKRTHIWQVDVRETASGKLVATGRLTVMVLPLNS